MRKKQEQKQEQEEEETERERESHSNHYVLISYEYHPCITEARVPVLKIKILQKNADIAR